MAGTPAARLRVGISACLLGHEVRYDGGHKHDPFLTETLGKYVEWVPVCPEMEVGLGVPRETIRLEGDPAAPRLVAPGSGTDHTRAMDRLVRTRSEMLAGQRLVGFVVKKDSPSCGLERVRVWGRSATPARTGVGVFTRALMDRLPLLPVEEEGRLHDPVLRENFVERLFAYARWQELVAARVTRSALVRFHTVHKLALLAHDEAAYRRLGRLVAHAKERPMGEVVAAYGAGFMATLRVRATPGRQTNVLLHALGYVSERLAPAERAEMVELIDDYRRGVVPLVVPLTLLQHHLRRHPVPYLAEQTYLDPHPKELMLRNHV